MKASKELTKGNNEEKINRENKKLRAKQDKFMQVFLKSRLLPVLVGQPDTLNEKEGFYHAKYLRMLGFSIIKNRHGMFTCIFPKGWTKIPMQNKNDWCYLIDNKRRARAAICYRIMGYVRDGAGRRAMSYSAFMNYMPRFRATVDHVVPYSIIERNTDEHYNSPMVGGILDSEEFIYTTDSVEMKNKYGDDDYNQEEKEIRSHLQAKCQELLDEYLPMADSIFKYWDENDEEKIRIKNFNNKLRDL